MNFTGLISFITRSLRVAITGLLCVTLLFSNALPAAAIGASKSSAAKGAEQLKGIQKETDKVANSNPRSSQETQSKAQKGLNAVQGDADKDKMNRPGNSQNATAVKEEVKGFLNNMAGN